MKRRREKEEEKPEKRKQPIRLITFGEYQAGLVKVRAKVDRAWSPTAEDELNRRLETINGLIAKDHAHGSTTAVLLDAKTELSREVTGAFTLLQKWAARLSS